MTFPSILDSWLFLPLSSASLFIHSPSSTLYLSFLILKILIHFLTIIHPPDSDNYSPHPSSLKKEFTALSHSKHAEACNYLLVIICVYIDVEFQTTGIPIVWEQERKSIPGNSVTGRGFGQRSGGEVTVHNRSFFSEKKYRIRQT